MPAYRGFSKTFNKYILGIPYFSDGRYYMLVDDCNKNNDIGTGSFPIDETTLSINFPDTDIKELFFGIYNGKGASIIEALFIEDNTPLKGVAMHTHYGYVFYDKNDDWVHITKLKDIKVIGIQK